MNAFHATNRSPQFGKSREPIATVKCELSACYLRNLTKDISGPTLDIFRAWVLNVPPIRFDLVSGT